jgi:hypothetical protein
MGCCDGGAPETLWLLTPTRHCWRYWQAAGGSVKWPVAPVWVTPPGLVTPPGELHKVRTAKRPELLRAFRAAALKQRCRRSSSRQSTCLSAAKSIACINRHKWISGPITTARNERMSAKMPAVARVALTAWRWFTEAAGAVLWFSGTTHSAFDRPDLKPPSQDWPQCHIL